MCCLSDKFALARAQCTSVHKDNLHPGDKQCTHAATGWSLFKETYNQITELNKYVNWSQMQLIQVYTFRLIITLNELRRHCALHVSPQLMLVTLLYGRSPHPK